MRRSLILSWLLTAGCADDEFECDQPPIEVEQTYVVSEDDFFAVGGLPTALGSEGCRKLCVDYSETEESITNWIECRYDGAMADGHHVYCHFEHEAHCVF